MRILKKTDIKFLSIRNVTYFISSTVILVGLFTLFFKGLSYGIDFLGGTEIVVEFERPMTIGEIRNALASEVPITPGITSSRRVLTSSLVASDWGAVVGIAMIDAVVCAWLTVGSCTKRTPSVWLMASASWSVMDGSADWSTAI